MSFKTRRIQSTVSHGPHRQIVPVPTLRRSSRSAAGAESPRVSVVIPCYNYGRYLRASVMSVLTQPGVVVEVVIVDDASTDESPEVASSLASADPRVRVLRHSHNKGHIETYNDGLAAIHGDYVVLLSADDLLTPGALERATRLMQTYPSVGLVYGYPRDFTGTAPPRPRARVRSWTVWPGHEWIRLLTLRGFSCVESPEVVLRASVQDAIGFYRPELPHSADLHMWLHAAAVSDVGRVNGPDQALRRLHGGNMSRTQYAGVVVDLSERVKAFDSFFQSPGADIANAGLLMVQMRQSIAIEALDHACDAVVWGEATAEYIDKTLAFVERLSPDVIGGWCWRDLAATPRGESPKAARMLFRIIQARKRDLQRRIRLRRWRRNGV